LAYVGRIKHSKGLDDAIDACERARRTGATVEFDIYGHFLPGDTYKRRFLERCNRTSGVQFLGKLPNEDVIATLQEYDVFLFPTFYEGEGFPGVVVEALAAGCPVLASDWKYSDEIITHGVDGILFEPRNVEELAQAITRLSENPVDLEEMKRNAFERSHAYSVDTVVDDILRYLAEAGWDIPNQQAKQ